MPVIGRRAAIAAFVGTAASLLLHPPGKAAAAQRATLVARRVLQVPQDPEDPAWQQALPLDIPLSPQVIVKPRHYEGGVTSIRARALYDEDRLGFLVEWGDQKKDVALGGVDSYRDAVAVEFSSDPSAPIPYFGMGQHDNPVVIYHWKADWQFAREYDVDEEFPHMAVDVYPYSGKAPGQIAEGADYDRGDGDKAFNTAWWSGNPLADPEIQVKTSVEKLTASGFGTIESAKSQDALGSAVWQEGAWRVVISVPRAQERFTFAQGHTIPVAFAAWDGSRQERGGEKSVSTWFFLSLEQPTGAFSFISPVLVVMGVAVAQLLALRLLRRRRRPEAAS